MTKTRMTRSGAPLGAYFLALVLALALAACAGKPVAERAPVEERSPVVKADRKPPVAEAEGNFYVVQKGETLSRIAARHKISVADLAAWNNISDPNRVEVDQRLRIVPPSAAAPAPAAPSAKPAAEGATTQPVAAVAPVESRPLPPASGQTAGQAAAKPTQPPAATPAPASTAPAAPPKPASGDKHEPLAGKQAYSEQNLAKARASAGLPPAPAAAPESKAVADGKPGAKPADAKGAASLNWAWPAPGKVVKAYDGNASKGVDIAGQAGDPVLAAGAGKVVYAGSGLRGYGKLVIVKHNTQFLSAYGDNSQILVKEGESVAQGQKIAEMGKAEGGGRVHFEVRQQGKPVDPMKFLPARE